MTKEKDLQVEAYNENNPSPHDLDIQSREEGLAAADNIDSVEEPMTEIEVTQEEKDEINNQADPDPDYLEHSAEAVGYINREHQWQTYRTILNYIPTGDSVLDFGCGRGDFERFYETESTGGLNYIGIDMNQQLIDASKKAYGDEVDVRCANWFELDSNLKQDWSININSNNLRYDTKLVTDEEYLYDTIDSMYKHANKGVFILLSSSIPGLTGDLIDNDPGKIFNWIQKKYEFTALDHTISNDLFLIAIYKNIKT